MSGLKVVMLDIEGTLFTEAAESQRIPADFAKILRLIGKGGDKLIPEAFGVPENNDLRKTLGRLKGKIFKERFLPHLGPTPGARDVIQQGGRGSAS